MKYLELTIIYFTTSLKTFLKKIKNIFPLPFPTILNKANIIIKLKRLNIIDIKDAILQMRKNNLNK